MNLRTCFLESQEVFREGWEVLRKVWRVSLDVLRAWGPAWRDCLFAR